MPWKLTKHGYVWSETGDCHLPQAPPSPSMPSKIKSSNKPYWPKRSGVKIKIPKGTYLIVDVKKPE